MSFDIKPDVTFSDFTTKKRIFTTFWFQNCKNCKVLLPWSRSIWKKYLWFLPLCPPRLGWGHKAAIMDRVRSNTYLFLWGFLDPILTVRPLWTIRRARARPKSPLPIKAILSGFASSVQVNNFERISFVYNFIIDFEQSLLIYDSTAM